MNKYWENPEVLSIGRLPSRASFTASGKKIGLDGKWKFKWANNPEKADNWLKRGTEGWLEVNIPSLWTMDDRISEDKPIYTNVLLPFKGEPPSVPKNPAGIYKKKFTIRKKYASSIEANAIHGSDSDENAQIEIDFFFKTQK